LGERYEVGQVDDDTINKTKDSGGNKDVAAKDHDWIGI